MVKCRVYLFMFTYLKGYSSSFIILYPWLAKNGYLVGLRETVQGNYTTIIIIAFFNIFFKWAVLNEICPCRGLLYRGACGRDFLCGWPSLGSYLEWGEEGFLGECCIHDTVTSLEIFLCFEWGFGGCRVRRGSRWRVLWWSNIWSV